MSVIGIDFGNESCYVAAAKAGGIETLANDYSLRATPSCVAFAGKKRILGVAAKNQMVTNLKNTIFGFKKLLGRKFNDPHVQHELKKLPFRAEPLQNNVIGIRVNYLDKEHVFTPEQLLAMLFTKLKVDSTSALGGAQVNDCVIAVPWYFTNAERKALLDAAAIAGLNVLRLINETTATALSYGFYKQDLPAVEEKSRFVAFVDCGHASLQVSICAFNKGKLRMVTSACEQLGGRDFDEILANYFSDEFGSKYKIDPRTNARAYLRLLTEVEKIKKQMSANSTVLPFNIECFMNDMDVSSNLQRAKFEELSGHLLKRIEETMRKCLKDSKLSLDEIHSVEIVGGSTRIPAIKGIIEKVFGKHASTTLNQDEAVSRGAALQCAIMSPAVRVRDFKVQDIQNYPVHVSWDGDPSNENRMEVFPALHAAPFSRQLTLYRREPFSMEIYYGDVPYPDPYIGRWIIRDIKPNALGESQEVKVKIRINQNGIVGITSATLTEKKDQNDVTPDGNVPENTEGQQEQKQQSPQQQEEMDVTPEDNSGDGKKEKKKSGVKLVELPIDVQTHGFSSTDLNGYIEQESKMIFNDASEKERVDARNALEEYVYEMRDKLQEDGPLSGYVMQMDRENIVNQLNNLENWLYEEGEDCAKDVYISKLSNLRSHIDPIKSRCAEYEAQPGVLNELGHAIQLAHKVINEYRSGDAKYDHLLETDMLNISETADKTFKWLEEARGKLVATPKTKDPPVKIADIQHEYQTLTTCVNSVLSRPKPKPPQQQPPPQQQNNGTDAGNQANHDQQQNHTGTDDKQQAQQPKHANEDTMDID
ncbi:heat shock 70 kDa protein 4 isoform X2 [Lutzomyia longipalpis]|uniref:Putative heat shock 70 kDa protein 4-like isoform x3 n=1 Tax=Lutzomyia longipalpis TaxID=7200 RepID=A0A7G3ADY8_LUTLO|nr:heat shock 70 kDa protein 4 isoform X2 [Lutzomyia longipalpis]